MKIQMEKAKVIKNGNVNLETINSGNVPVMLSLPFEVIERRAKYFRDKLHKYEAQRLEECLRTLKELIPPDWWESKGNGA